MKNIVVDNIQTIQIVEDRSLPTCLADGVPVHDLAELIHLDVLRRRRQADYHREIFIPSMKGTTKAVFE